MELTECIKHVLDGNAVIIMGAGASCGAQNIYGHTFLGSDLAKELYSQCEMEPDDENDLQDAAQCYEEKFSAQRLISEVRALLMYTSVTESHKTIYALPWMRYYTTNYDNVAFLAARDSGKYLTPVTLTTPLKDISEDENLCVHINGYIGNLNETTLHHEFKLTANSYLSQINIMNSEWGDFLINDLDTAKCIVIIGLSLKYDLDLSRIIFKPEFLDKTVIIDSPSLTQNAENRLARFGTVYKIGIDDFARKIENIQKEYVPEIKSPTDRLYEAFIYEYARKYDCISQTPEDIFRLFLNGQYSDSLFHKSKGKYDGFIYRKKFSEIHNAIKQGKRFIFIHSDMGNGKTACLNELRFWLSSENFHIFILDKPDSSKLSEEIAAICNLSKSSTCIVIVDDYTNYMEIMHKFALSDNNIQFVLAARSALNYNKMPIILNDFKAKEGISSVFDINRLEPADIENCIKVFDTFGLFGNRSKLKHHEKIEYLRSQKGGASKFQSIMLDLLKSDIMREKIAKLVQLIKDDSGQYYSAVLLCLLTEIMNLRLSPTDIERVSGINLLTDAQFRTNVAISELIDFNNTNKLKIKSPVTARFILQNISNPTSIMDSLLSLAEYAEKYLTTAKYSNILTTIISYSHINSFLHDFRNPKQFLANYYDKLSKIECFKSNNFFWLQYAISCIEIQKFDRAQFYLDTAYGLIPDGFIPFQINNQQARLYLEKIKHSNSQDPINDFNKAHKLLMIPVASPKDNEYNVVRLFDYYTNEKIRKALYKADGENEYKSACKDAYIRTDRFIAEHPSYTKELNKLKVNLLKLYSVDETV